MKYKITFIDKSNKIIETNISLGQFFNNYNHSQPFDKIDGVIINFANVLYIEELKNFNDNVCYAKLYEKCNENFSECQARGYCKFDYNRGMIREL